MMNGLTKKYEQGSLAGEAGRAGLQTKDLVERQEFAVRDLQL